MNPLLGSIFSPVLFLPGIVLRYLPFKDLISKKQKLNLFLLYIPAILIHMAVYYFVGINANGLNISFLKTDMILFALALSVVNMVVIRGKIREHLFVYGLTMLINYMDLTLSLFLANNFNVFSIENRFLLYIINYFFLYIIFIPFCLKLLNITVTPFLNVKNNKYWNTIWFVPTAMFLSCYFTVYGEDTIDTLPPVIGRMLLLVCAVLICVSVARSQIRITEQIETKRQLDMQTAYYNELSESVVKARQTRHDLKHHMAAIQRYIDSDDKEGLQEYCYDFSRHQSGEVIPYTGNAAADGVLYHYSKIASENDIKFEMKGTIKSKSLADVDLCVLLGNALDNAVNGCLTVTENRFVSVVSESDDFTLTVMVTNSFDGHIEKERNIIMSRKADGRRGVGLESMRNICRKNNGSMEINNDGKTFTVIFILPVV